MVRDVAGPERLVARVGADLVEEVADPIRRERDAELVPADPPLLAPQADVAVVALDGLEELAHEEGGAQQLADGPRRRR